MPNLYCAHFVVPLSFVLLYCAHLCACFVGYKESTDQKVWSFCLLSLLRKEVQTFAASMEKSTSSDPTSSVNLNSKLSISSEDMPGVEDISESSWSEGDTEESISGVETLDSDSLTESASESDDEDTEMERDIWGIPPDWPLHLRKMVRKRLQQWDPLGNRVVTGWKLSSHRNKYYTPPTPPKRRFMPYKIPPSLSGEKAPNLCLPREEHQAFVLESKRMKK